MRSTGAPAAPRARTRFGWAGLTVALICTATLAAGCGGGRSSSSAGSASTAAASYREDLAYAHCMQIHGLPDFPDPKPSGNFKVSGKLVGSPNSPAARANDACKHLLSRSSTGTNGATASPTTAPPGSVTTDCLTSQSPCYTPLQFRVAYGIQPLLASGITGRGQTIVLPEFPPVADTGVQVPTVTDIRQDLAAFDRRFHLPAARLQIVNTLAHAASPRLASIEEAEDTEIVHAAAPDAAIREILIPSTYTANPDTVTAAVVAALKLGLAEGTVISLSAGAGEQCFTPAEVAQVNSVLQAAQRDRVTVVVSSGDSGAATTACPPETGAAAVKGVDLPASDPLALDVGGTRLQASPKTGAYIGETAWNIPPSTGGPRAGGGGFSRLFHRPAYQDGITHTEPTRGTPDAAADADPRTGMALTITDGGKHTMLIGAGGASAAAPLWAAVIALANQYAGRRLGFITPALYRIGSSASYHRAFHDVTSGTDTIHLRGQIITGSQATPGWDPVTGWGSPNAQALVPLLARDVKP